MTSEFIIDGWSAAGPDITLRYRSGEFSFAEQVRFPVDVDTTESVARLLDLLAIIAGVSYAKAVAPATVIFPQLDISEAGYELVHQVYDEGMREFAFHNGLPLTSAFVINDKPRGEDFTSEARTGPGSPLIPFGAGRDSCVVASALKHLNPTLFTIGEHPYAKRVAEQLSLRLLTASRTIDPLLLTLNESGAPNGHIPVTAINSMISLIVAELTGHTSVVMANEKAASRPTRVVDGVYINHQYSKSAQFEHALFAAVDMAGVFVPYTSVLRDASDRAISRAFATKCSQLHSLFMSCNQAMLRDPSRRSDGWCCQCPKCRGMFLSLAPFLSPPQMKNIFGQDLLDDISQVDGFHDLMSDDMKPFECVADVDEARDSMLRLIASAEWSQHCVVQASREVASQQSQIPQDDSSEWFSGAFKDEIDSFLSEPA
jgi:hypothetical protein